MALVTSLHYEKKYRSLFIIEMSVMGDNEIIHRYLIPILNTLLWSTGLAIGVFGLLPQADSPSTQFLIAAYSVYILFIFEVLIDSLDILARSEEQYFGANIFGMFGLFVLMFLIVVLATFAHIYGSNQVLCKTIILVGMISHKFLIAFLKRNAQCFLLNIRGDVYNSNI